MEVISTHGTEVMCAVKLHEGSGLTLRIEPDGVCGFEEFSIDYPQWLHHSLSTNGFEPGMNGVPALAPIGTSEVQMLPWSRPENKRPFPKPYPNAVTTYLFLGNGEVAGNLSKLQEKNITFVLNLTPNIPNYFEGEESGITYLRIPLTDSVTESLIPHITDANNFIDKETHNRDTMYEISHQQSVCYVAVFQVFSNMTIKGEQLPLKGNSLSPAF
ncbi:hypothetical protein CDAR_318181 [Caerostris darwini]|uniref:protein-tyrosine-phosphatase n=1 Tax=Caerostris darwini TaxID=1538125 RepID=A0AAV4T869_9ARAC|nr:hypothetical protein CDAR_318181 [Caerostris darwini]